MHPIDVVSQLTKISNNTFQASTSEAYNNLAGPFGGATAATMLRAVMDHPERLADPISYTVNFCAALKNGQYIIETSLQRSGRYLQHWVLTLTQNDTVCATATVACGRRDETFGFDPASPPAASAYETYKTLDTSQLPGWLNCYEFRPVDNVVEFSAKPHAELRNPRNVHWIRDHPPRPLDYISLAALSDSFVLRLLYVRGTMVPMGTVSMTTIFHATADEITQQGESPLLGVATAKRFHNNFHDQSMELWGTSGKLLASGNQLVWYKA